MAGLQINPTDIAKARESGYSDDEIVGFLAAKAPDQFKQAQAAGYGSKEILAHLSGDSEKPSGIAAGALEGASNVIHGIAETGKQFLGMDTAGVEARAQKLAPKDYKGTHVIPSDTWYDPRTYNYSQIPQAMAEAAPGMATDIAVTKLGARVHPLLGVGAGLASYLLRTRGDAAKNDAAIRTGDANAEPETQDKTRALLTGAAEAVPQAIGLRRFLPGAGAIRAVGGKGVAQSLVKPLTTAAVEGGTGAASNAISQAGATVGTDKGLTVDPAQVVEAGVTNAATGGALAVPRGLADARGSMKYAKFGGDNQEATTAFMNRASQAADGAKLTPKSSFEALRTADEGVRDELKQAVKPIKNDLDSDTSDALKRAGKGRTLTDSDLNIIEQNTTPDIAFLARQAHVASLVKQAGDYGQGRFTGGIANIGEKHVRALQNIPGAVTSTALGAMALNGHAASMFAYGPQALGAIVGGYGVARGIDSLTGNRVPLRGLMDRFADPSAVVRQAAPVAPQPAPQPAVGPTGPQVLFNPGVAGGGTALALGQNPFAVSAAPTRPPMDANAAHEDLKGMLRMAAARRDVAAAQTPQAPEPLNANALNEQVKSALLMAGARRKVEGQRSAEGLAQDSPIINENGGLDNLINPAFGKRANELLSAARAHAALTRVAPEEEAPQPQVPSPPVAPNGGPLEPTLAAPRPSGEGVTAPQARSPMDVAKALAKITKKAGGKAKAEAPEAPFEPAYAPLSPDQLWGRGLQDKTFATHELSKELEAGKAIHNEKGYTDSIVHDRTKRRNILAEIAGNHEGDSDVIAQLLEELHHTRRAAKAHAAIAHFTKQMSPEAAAAVRKRMDKSYINGTWQS